MSVFESRALSAAIVRLLHRQDLDHRSPKRRHLESSDKPHRLPRLVKMRTSSTPPSATSASSSNPDSGSSSSAANDADRSSSVRSRDFSAHPSSSSSPAPNLQFFVRVPSRTLVIHADPEDTVDSVIDRIHKTGISTFDHRLIHCGRQLEPQSTLAQSGIENDSTLQLIGRLRSTNYPKAWRLVASLISSVYKLLDGYLEGPDLTREDPSMSTIEQIMIGFLGEAFKANDKSWAVLEIFLLAGAPNVLVKLYLSPLRCNRTVVKGVVQTFGDIAIAGDVQIQCAPIVFEFCKLLAGTAGKSDPLYISCRRMLAGILKKADPRTLGRLRCPNVIYELFSFVTEMKEIVLGEVSSDSMMFTLDSVEVLADFLDAMRHAMESSVGMSGPIPKSTYGSLHHYYEYWIGALHAMFLEFLVKIDSYLRKVKELYLVQSEPQVVLWSNILTVLTQCNAFPKFYENAEPLLHRFLLEHRGTLNLLLSRADRRDDLLWFLKYKDVTDFGARKNLVMMMLPQAMKSDYLHEMLIDRRQLLAESFEYITQAKVKALHGMIFMEFKNEEATGPGVLREWFCLVFRELFKPTNVLFLPCPNDRRRFFLNPTSFVDPLHLRYYGFCGRMMSLALMHKVQVGIVFDRVLFLQLAGRSVTLQDIYNADPCLYKSCKKILEMDDALLDSDALGLTFMIEVEQLGSRRDIELCAGGKDIVVNSRNKEEYVNLLIQQRFVTSTSEQLSHLAHGFGDILSDSNSQKFFFQSLDLEDFDRILGGNDNIISVADWKAHTDYKGYKESDRTISWFWKVVEDMTVEQQRMLLCFWTSVKYLPAEGFSGLGSRLYIYKVSGHNKPLPTSHTCFYRLCLPAYKSKALMNDRLRFITQEHVSCSFGMV